MCYSIYILTFPKNMIKNGGLYAVIVDMRLAVSYTELSLCYMEGLTHILFLLGLNKILLTWVNALSWFSIEERDPLCTCILFLLNAFPDLLTIYFSTADNILFLKHFIAAFICIIKNKLIFKLFWLATIYIYIKYN